MIAELLLDETVVGRLTADCTKHEQTVRDLLLARKDGELDSELTFRHCAMELHSVKGMASVLGLHTILTMIEPLGDSMLRGQARFPERAWDEFGHWFSGLIASVRACAQGLPDRELQRRTMARSDLLLRALGSGVVVDRNHPQEPRSWALSPSAGRRILVVDDSATVRAALSAQLRDRGYPVRSARDLLETAELLGSFTPEIVVTDVQMPDVDGDELCRRLKARMTQVVPVVLYSSLPVAQLCERARAAGADGYVSKASGVDALVRCMDSLLSDEILF